MQNDEVNLLGFCLGETVAATVFTCAFCALFAWLPYSGVESIPLDGPTGAIFDLIPTIFMSVLMITLFETMITRKRLQGKNLRRVSFYVPRWCPQNPLLRGILFGLIALVFYFPASVIAMKTTGLFPLDYDTFFIYKIVYGAILAIPVAPFVVLTAMGDVAGKKY